MPACLSVLGVALVVGVVMSRSVSMRAEPATDESGTHSTTRSGAKGVDVEPALPGRESVARSPWATTDQATASRFAPRPPIPADAAVVVELAGDSRHWEVGDRINISIPQLEAEYTSVVERVDSAFGSRAYSGRLLPGDVIPNSFVITVGPASTFATLVTPRGAFELVGNTRFAWMMSTSAMYDHLPQMPPDYHIPPRYREES